MAIKIYTKTGDKGETSLWGGTRIPKYSLRVEAYGTVDELNAVFGVAVAEIADKNYQEIKKEIEQLPHDLYNISALLAIPGDTHLEKGKKIHKALPVYLKKRVIAMEKCIDVVTRQLPPLRDFVLPGGGRAGAAWHQARTVCRRAERRIVELADKEYVPVEVVVYVNRLSDFLFTVARFVNYKDTQKEILWNKHKAF
jgi:cob(I)alamin adenosyltransferase